MYKKLLVPVDGGDLTDRAMTQSIALARQLGASITAFVVEPDMPLPNVGTRLLLLDEPFEGVAPALSRRLADVISSLKGRVAVLISQSDLNHSRSLLDAEFVIERGANVGAAAPA